MPIDITALAEILRGAAKAEILPRWRRLTPDMVRSKSNPADLVTEADEMAERFIRARVAALAPEALFVGEESVAADPALMDGIAGADLSVVVDPVDGTGNFAAGLPLFAVMAAIVAKGETVGGVIYDPFADDFVMAERGGGAFIRRADGSAVPIKAAEPVPLSEMVGAASMAFLPHPVRSSVYPNLAKVRAASAYRCAGHEYRAFASGHLHFLFFSKLMPWDHLAGSLIAREAGAYGALLDGTPYRAGLTSGDLLLATDRSSWESLRREIFVL
ncbi:MAG: inositol monophosphatase [Devosia sp.]|nr:inositol monophosphatase [Devosia sp.]